MHRMVRALRALLQDLQAPSRRGAVDRRRARRAGLQRAQRPAADVAEDVEHGLAGDILAERVAIAALVEEPAGLLSGLNRNLEAHARFLDRDGIRNLAYFLQ